MTTATLEVINKEELASLLKISMRTLARRRSEGQILDPLGYSAAQPRWALEEVQEWVRAGCPTAATWKRRKRS